MFKRLSGTMPKFIGIVAIFAILILMIDIFPSDNSKSLIVESHSGDFDEEMDPQEMDPQLSPIDFSSFDYKSIVSTDIIFTESDDALITQFLDNMEIDSPLSTEKFGIETQIVLFDSDQNQYPSSNILGIPQLTVIDSEGRILDLGTIQTSFAGITRESEMTFDMFGTVEFYLDDTLISTKKLYASDTKQSVHPISIIDNLVIVTDKQSSKTTTTTTVEDTVNIISETTDVYKQTAIPPLITATDTNFTFTLSDEGRDWADLSEHSYRVVLRDITANVNSDNDHKTFTWTGQHIAYELKVTVDSSKYVVLGDDNKALEVLKADSTFSHTPKCLGVQTISPTYTTYCPQSPRVEILDDTGKILFDSKTKLTKAGVLYSGFARNSDYTIKVDSVPYNIHTLKSQQNFFIGCEKVKTGDGMPWQGLTDARCTSNFGYEDKMDVTCGAVTNYNTGLLQLKRGHDQC